jgi:hypothetical protein
MKSASENWNGIGNVIVGRDSAFQSEKITTRLTLVGKVPEQYGRCVDNHIFLLQVKVPGPLAPTSEISLLKTFQMDS